MNRNRKKAAAATLAAGMAVVLGAGTVMAAASTGDNGLQKEETVYVNTTAGGEVTDVTVSDWLKNSGDSSNSEVKDASDLQDIKNVKGDETFTQNGNDLTWSTDGKDIYYQGKTEKNLPVSVGIKYYMDGTEVSPEALAGKTGHLKMEVTYTNTSKTTKTVNGKKTDIYSPFVMVTGMILPVDKFENVKPILTPRFTPSCSDELMEKLSEIQKRYHLPMQSHLSENFGEIAWVKELCPNTHFYGEAYSQFDLFGGDCPTIMAHCVHSSNEEIALMKKQGVYIAHCPQSNTNLASGISPARRYLDEGLHIGLGSDIAGGTSVSILRAMADAIQVSKLYWRLVDSSMKPLTVEEAFYMGTEGGGSFFGKMGSFKEGYEFDAVVLNDSTIPTPLKLSPKDRLERLIYLSDDRNITAKYVAGRKIL